MDLIELRKQMDEIDRELLLAFQKRMELSRQIAEVKQQRGTPTYDPKREQEKLNAASEMLPEPLKCYAAPLYARLMELSRDYQNRLLHRQEIQQSYQLGNIILIGMPGCGKSTLGKALSLALQRPFWDCDTELSKRYGLPAGELLSQLGESEFRSRESALLRELCSNHGIVLSTGGGCVTRPENRELFRRSGTVLWIQRDLQELATSGRPLSLSKGIDRLWKEREPLYRAFSDFTIVNSGSISQTVQEICRRLGYILSETE